MTFSFYLRLTCDKAKLYRNENTNRIPINTATGQPSWFTLLWPSPFWPDQTFCWISTNKRPSTVRFAYPPRVFSLVGSLTIERNTRLFLSLPSSYQLRLKTRIRLPFTSSPTWLDSLLTLFLWWESSGLGRAKEISCTLVMLPFISSRALFLRFAQRLSSPLMQRVSAF